MIVYMEAHPIVLDTMFAVLTVGAFTLGFMKVCRVVEKTRADILKAIQSRNDLLREGFAALAGLLANKPCNKFCDKESIKELPVVEAQPNTVMDTVVVKGI